MRSQTAPGFKIAVQLLPWVYSLVARKHLAESRVHSSQDHQLLRKRIGSSGVAPLRTSKCNCGALTLPV